MADSHRKLDGDAWVEFKPSGYPYKLGRQLRETRQEGDVLTIIASYVIACHLPKLDGAWLDKAEKADDFDDVDEQVVIGVIRAFYDFRQERMYAPASPNS